MTVACRCVGKLSSKTRLLGCSVAGVAMVVRVVVTSASFSCDVRSLPLCGDVTCVGTMERCDLDPHNNRQHEEEDGEKELRSNFAFVSFRIFRTLFLLLVFQLPPPGSP